MAPVGLRAAGGGVKAPAGRRDDRLCRVLLAVVLAAASCGGTPLVPGTGGVPGQGGGAGLCDQLQAQYSAAVNAALACTPGVPNQCQFIVGLTASACPSTDCGNRAFVNDDTQVEAVRESWVSACGPPGFLGCPASACVPPAPRTCVPTSQGASTGTCLPVQPSDPPDAAYESCDQLSADYSLALNAALFCTPGAPNQCQQLAVTQAVCNGLCPYYEAVNDATGTLAAGHRWSAQCCNSTFMCNGLPPPTGACIAVDGGSPTGGVCVPGKRPSQNRDAGAPPDGGESCDQLTADYVLAASAALACTPGAPNQCEAQVDQQPGPCGNCGSMAANDSTAVSAAWQRWQAAGCAGNAHCSGTACTPLPPGPCVQAGSGSQSAGICLNASPAGGT